MKKVILVLKKIRSYK